MTGGVMRSGGHFAIAPCLMKLFDHAVRQGASSLGLRGRGALPTNELGPQCIGRFHQAVECMRSTVVPQPSSDRRGLCEADPSSPASWRGVFVPTRYVPKNPLHICALTWGVVRQKLAAGDLAAAEHNEWSV